MSTFINEENKKKTELIVNDMNEFAVLADNKDDSKYVDGVDGVPGIGLPVEAETIRTLKNDIEDGIFKVLVMGKFKNGKSTFINALVGKLMMASKATACTAVIATVNYGKECDTVNVVYTDGRSPEKMSLEKFTEDFALSEADQNLIEETGNLDRFEKVDHVEMHSMDDMFRDGLQLIDSPGLEEASARTKTTQEFVPRANAIIFTMSATSLFSAKEKECISDYFAGKHMRNVFFVVNRIDNLNEGQLEESVIPAVREGLEEVFEDSNGNFDEKLYNKRVFFTNAYGAQCIRIGEPYKVIIGKKAQTVDIDLEDTGMLEFEAALKEFLNSDERIKATFSSTLSGMANTYEAAKNTVDMAIAVSLQSAEEREKNARAAQKELDNARKEVEGIRQTVKSSGGVIAQKTYLDLINYAQIDLPREFAATAKSIEMQEKFGIGKMGKMAAAMAAQTLPFEGVKKWGEEKYKDVLQPYADSVNQYIAKKLREDWPRRVPILIKSDIDLLQEELNSKAEDFDMSLEKAVNLFVNGNAKISGNKGNGLKMGLQTLIALSNWDISLATEGMAEGGLSWGEFAKKVALQLVIDGAITVVLGAPLLIPALIIEVLCMQHKASQMGDQMLTNIGNKAFEELKKSIEKKEFNIKEEIVAQYIEHGEKLASAGVALVAEQEAFMNKLLNDNKEGADTAKAENDRLVTNLTKMHDLVEHVYSELYGHIPSVLEFNNLSRNVKQNGN